MISIMLSTSLKNHYCLCYICLYYEFLRLWSTGVSLWLRLMFEVVNTLPSFDFNVVIPVNVYVCSNSTYVLHFPVFLTNAMAEAPTTDLWIGLISINKTPYYWTNGQPVKYTSFQRDVSAPCCFVTLSRGQMCRIATTLAHGGEQRSFMGKFGPGYKAQEKSR